MAKRGKGTKYAKKYVTVTQDQMRRTIIPQAVEFCAIQRAEQAWSAAEYKACLSRNIKALIKGLPMT